MPLESVQPVGTRDIVRGTAVTAYFGKQAYFSSPEGPIRWQ
jgi:hypothetical protein